MAWLIAAFAVLPSLALCAWMALRGSEEQRLAGLLMTGTLVVLLMVLFAMAWGRDVYLDLPLALAILSFGTGLMFVRFLEKYL